MISVVGMYSIELVHVISLQALPFVSIHDRDAAIELQ